MDLPIRPYDEATDLDHVLRMWLEVGWIDSADKRDALQAFFAAANAEVGLIDDEAECAVHWTPGNIRYQATDLGLCAITAVTTSHIGRRQGLASTLTARALQQGADAGHAVAALGMFEQGFYDRVGFGTAAYDDVNAAEDITYVHAANAIAAFEAESWRFDNSPFDRYLRGDRRALSQSQQAGMRLFYK